jgi:LPXTG-motif cell wall-anchored protein
MALVVVGAPAWATDKPNYPPSTEPGSEVKGVTSGVGNSGANLPHTGFDSTYLVVGAAVLLLGILLVIASRRRAR